jgi:hypothetical protein
LYQGLGHSEKERRGEGSKTMRVRVETNDTSGCEIPERIHFDDRSVDIAEMLDQWHGADERYFKLRGRDGNLYMLRFDEITNSWNLTIYKSQHAEDITVPARGKGRAH